MFFDKDNVNIDTLFSYENKEDSSLKEINKYLEGGEYIIMIYLEHLHNEAVIRFFFFFDIDIYLIDKIDKDKLMYNYDLDLTEKIINIIFDSEDEYYKENDTNFYKLAQEIDSMIAKIKNPSKKSTSSFGSDSGETILEEDF